MTSSSTFIMHEDPWWSYFLRLSEPYKEGARQFEACFSGEETSLWGRVTHFVKGAGYWLLPPPINTIIYLAKERFSTSSSEKPASLNGRKFESSESSSSSSPSSSSKSITSSVTKKLVIDPKKPTPPPGRPPAKRRELTEEERQKLEKAKKERAEREAKRKKEQAEQAELRKKIDTTLAEAKKNTRSPEKALEKIDKTRETLLEKKESIAVALFKTLMNRLDAAAVGYYISSVRAKIHNLEKEDALKEIHRERAQLLEKLEHHPSSTDKTKTERLEALAFEIFPVAKAFIKVATDIGKNYNGFLKECKSLKNQFESFLKEYEEVEHPSESFLEEYEAVKNQFENFLKEYELIKNSSEGLSPKADAAPDPTKRVAKEYEDIKVRFESQKKKLVINSEDKKVDIFEKRIYFLDQICHLFKDLKGLPGIVDQKFIREAIIQHIENSTPESFAREKMLDKVDEIYEIVSVLLADSDTKFDELKTLNQQLPEEETDVDDLAKVEFLKKANSLMYPYEAQLYFINDQQDEGQEAIAVLRIKVSPFIQEMPGKIIEANSLIEQIENDPEKENRAAYLSEINRLRSLLKATYPLIPDVGEDSELRKQIVDAAKRLEKAAVENDLIKKKWASQKKHYDRAQDGTIGRRGKQRRTLKSMKFTDIHTQSPTVSFSHKKGLNQNQPANNLCGYYALFFLYQSAMEAKKEEVIDGEKKISSEIDYCDRSNFNAFFKEARTFIWKQRTLAIISKLDEIPATLRPELMGLGMEEIKLLVQNIEFLAPLRDMENLYGLHLSGFHALKTTSLDKCSVPLKRLFSADESIPQGQETPSLKFPMNVVALIGAHYYFFNIEQREEDQWKISYTHSMSGNLEEDTCKELVHCLFMGKRLGGDVFKTQAWHNRRNPPAKK